MDTFRLCTTPQIFIETIEETFSKGRRLRFASSVSPGLTRQQGSCHETEETMRTDMCRQIGPCFCLEFSILYNKNVETMCFGSV